MWKCVMNVENVLEEYIFNPKANSKLYTAFVSVAWLHSRRVWMLNWNACSQDLLSTENMMR